MDKNLCHIGCMPPPLGGISVYLYRLKKIKANDMFVDSRSLRHFKFIWFALKCNMEIVIEGFYLKFLFILLLLKPIRKYPYSVVLHGEGIIKKYNEAGYCTKKLIEVLLYNCNFIQVVGLHVKDFLCDRIPCVVGKVIVKDAFLPPPLEDEPKILATYSYEMKEFIKMQRPLIVANAFQLADWNGTDLYGLDMCIELIHRLKRDYPAISLLFALANEKYRPDYYKKIRELIADYGLERNVYFLTDQHELWPILKECDVMVRPTCTDGYSVSIAETLYFKRPAVASDVCKRPDGCVVFRNRDMDDFEAKVRQVLERGK